MPNIDQEFEGSLLIDTHATYSESFMFLFFFVVSYTKQNRTAHKTQDLPEMNPTKRPREPDQSLVYDERRPRPRQVDSEEERVEVDASQAYLDGIAERLESMGLHPAASKLKHTKKIEKRYEQRESDVERCMVKLRRQHAELQSLRNQVSRARSREALIKDAFRHTKEVVREMDTVELAPNTLQAKRRLNDVIRRYNSLL